MPAPKTIAPGLSQIALDPLQAVNCYLAGDVLIDAGGRLDAKKILRALAGHDVAAHALTHVHPDHQGSSHAVCTALSIPFMVPAAEAKQGAQGSFDGLSGDSRRARISARIFAGPGHPVGRTLEAGDEVGGFVAVALPGHTPGQLGYWRESDRVLVCGDALRNISFASGRPGIRLPPDYFSVDMDGARRSAERILELGPELIAFGHGRPASGADRIATELRAALSA